MFRRVAASIQAETNRRTAMNLSYRQRVAEVTCLLKFLSICVYLCVFVLKRAVRKF
jgi:hypothetical protein